VFCSLKKGLMLEVRHTIPRNGPFQSYSDIKKYWKNIVSLVLLINYLSFIGLSLHFYYLVMTWFWFLIISLKYNLFYFNLNVF